MVLQEPASGQEGSRVQRPLHVLAGNSVQGAAAAAAAGPREPPERPHLLLIDTVNVGY